MSQAARLLGFAFASADLLVEIDRKGNIVFATGAASNFVTKGFGRLEGRPVTALFPPTEAAKFASHTLTLMQGQRKGPIKLKLVQGDTAVVSMFLLPQNGANISCTLSKQGSQGAFAGTAKDDQTGLPAKDAFLSAAVELAKPTDSLTLVEVPGLKDICAQMPADRARTLMANIGAALQSGVKAAGRLSETSFGALTDSSQGPVHFAGRIREVLAVSGVKAVPVEEAILSMRANISNEQRMLAVRYVVDRFAAGDQILTCGDNLESTFNAMMDETQARLKSLNEDLAQGAFHFAFQPIVNLKSGEVSHYESLVRFSNPEGTQETVKFVEALGLADAFDLAIAMKIIATVEAEPRKDVRYAFNISGHTISTPNSFGLLAGMLARKRNLAPRLIIEITETAEITDTATAAKGIAALRDMGFEVGLDDFGAGAASLNYLHAFPVDFVKFDGSLVKKLGASERDDTLLKGLVKLCGELGVETVAECIEDDAMRQLALDIGFDCGQGYFFGKPDAQLLPPAPKLGKRQGTRDTWG